MTKGQEAKENFVKGYNCCQSVVLPFLKELSLDNEMFLKMSSSFGGGFARLREVCGAVSGIFIVVGLVSGYSQASDLDGKKKHYQLLQDLANDFKEQNGSIICRELLNKTEVKSAIPEERTKEYYETRPCEKCVEVAANIVEKYLYSLK